MKLALVGNSHSMAVRAAFEGDRKKRANVTSFDAIHNWEGRSGTHPVLFLKALQGAGLSVVEVSSFDTFVVSACGCWAARNQHLLGTAPGHPLADVFQEGWEPTAPAGKAMVSAAGFDALVRGWVAESAISRLVRFLAIECDKPVIVQPWPAPTHLVRDDPSWVLRKTYGVRSTEVWKLFFDAQTRALQDLVAQLEGKATLLTYPLEEIAIDGFMPQAFGRSDDPFHGNVEYGRLVVAQIDAIVAHRKR